MNGNEKAKIIAKAVGCAVEIFVAGQSDLGLATLKGLRKAAEGESMGAQEFLETSAAFGATHRSIEAIVETIRREAMLAAGR